MSAQAVWLNDPSAPPFVFARYCFHLSGSVASSHFRCASTGDYLVYVNGAIHCRGLRNPLSADPLWQEVDIKEGLVPGDNELLLLLRNSDERDQRSWFIAEGTVITNTGKRVAIGTNRRWKMQPAAAWRKPNGEAELWVYEAQRDRVPDGTMQTEVSTWSEAVVVDVRGPLRESHAHNFELREGFATTIGREGEVEAGSALNIVEKPAPFKGCKFVQRQGLLKPTGALARIATGDGDNAVFLILDFERVLRGYPRLRFSAEAGNVIDVGWAQTIDELGGSISYRCAPGYQDWCSPMLARFRYLVLRFSHCKMPLHINCVSVMERSSPPLPQGRFDSSGIGTHVWHLGAASLEASRSEVYEAAARDWSGVYAHALNDFYQTGDTRTARATLERTSSPSTELQLAWLVLVAHIHGLYSGETDLALTLLSGLEKQLLEESEQALVASRSSEVGEVNPVVPVLLAAACKATGSIHRFTGSMEEAGVWSSRADKLAETLELFWSEEEKLYRSVFDPDGGRLLNALILFFSLVSDRRKVAMVDGIRGIEASGVTSLLTRFFEIGGFWKAGAVELAISGLQQHWSPLENGTGRTWAEKKNCAEPWVCPGVDYFLGSRILGVAPKTPGYQIVSIRPDAVGLDFAVGTINTARGAVEVDWRHQLEEHRFELSLQLETDGETHICLPRGMLRFPTVSLNGETVWQNEKVRPNSLVRELISEPEHITLVLEQAGRFHIELAP
jgi:hypothetical protein